MLRNLKYLQVGGGNLEANRSFSRRRFQSIESLPISITVLSFQYCGFSEADIPKDIGSLSSLKSLDLSGNSFHCLPFDFFKFRCLRELFLNDCENLQTLPSVSTLKKLTNLQLRNCQKLVQITGLDNHPSIEEINVGNCTSLQNPLNEGFFSAHALMNRRLRVQCNEIPDWCSNKVTAPSICLTMPTHNKGYKFLGMFLWFVFDFKGLSSTFERFSIALSDRGGVSMSRVGHLMQIDMPEQHKEVSCVHYISRSNNPFFHRMINGGEKITVKEDGYDGTVRKIGIHLLYLDQHGNATSLPAKKEKEKKRKRRIIFGGSRGLFLFPVSRETSARNKRAKL